MSLLVIPLVIDCYIDYVILYCLLGFFTIYCVFFFKQKTAYEMRISDWSSDVCSSDLSIADSNASMAGDMRSQIRERIMAGEEPEHIRAWQIERYEIGRASCRERVCQYV